MSETIKGTIVKGIAGFYYVLPEAGGSVLECKARGVFRKERITPYVGDRVVCSHITDSAIVPGTGRGARHCAQEGAADEPAVIEEILDRRNVFIRPPVANVDCFVVVMAAAKPAPNLLVLDQFLVMAEQEQTDIIICINKADLAAEATVAGLREIYGALYPLYFVCGKTGEGVEALARAVSGRKTALAGPSGVGKSTLLNRMLDGAHMETGAVSQKTNRGKHTTRHVELFPMAEGGMLFDTPGFTSFDVLTAKEDELFYFFPEMEAFAGHCRYDNCRHLSEPGCAVREALSRGEIHTSRYASYREMLEMIRRKKQW